MKKFEELIPAEGNVLPILAEVAPEIIEQLSDFKCRQIEKKVLQQVTAKQTEAIEQELLNDGGIDFKKVCAIYTRASVVNKTDNGAPKRKVSVRTRTRMKRKFND